MYSSEGKFKPQRIEREVNEYAAQCSDSTINTDEEINKSGKFKKPPRDAKDNVD